MAKFRCKLSGNIFEFTYEYDILSMRKHPQYDEVKEIPNAVQVKKTAKEKVIKKDKQ